MDKPVMAMGKQASEARWQAGGDSRRAGNNRGGVRRLEAVAGEGKVGWTELAMGKWASLEVR